MKSERTRDTCPVAFCVRCVQLAAPGIQPSKLSPKRPSGTARPNCPRAVRNAAPASAPMPPPVRTTGTSFFGSARANPYIAQISRSSTATPRKSIGMINSSA
jgi:hypothetical protein